MSSFDQNNRFRVGNYSFSNDIKMSSPGNKMSTLGNKYNMYVIKFPDGTIRNVSGPDIFEMLEKENVYSEHFNQYAKYINSKINSSNSTSYIIMETCMESYPCKHHVIIDGHTILMNGAEIYKMLKKDGKIDSHFDQYSDFK